MKNMSDKTDMYKANEKIKTPIIDFLKGHRRKKPVSFHMPGHKGMKIFEKYGYGDFFQQMADFDITEIDGADNLFHIEGIIGELMENYRALYEAKKSYLLINGSSCGIMAAILATVGSEGSLIMARNCHKSVYNAVALGKLKPIYAYPRVNEYGIGAEISVEEMGRLIEENPEAKAVILPSPNYYGICSDIEGMAKLVQEKGKVLIVDQAHGAHLKFFNCEKMPISAEEAGADIVINSTHKTLCSFTQTSIMNVMSDRVDVGELEDRLQQLESSSPSYLLMASLDMNARILGEHASELMGAWEENLDFFYEEAKKIKGLKLVNEGSMDISKLNLDMSEAGLRGFELERKLISEGIFPELVSGDLVMCMTGIGNIRSDYEKLLIGLGKISEELSIHTGKNMGSPKDETVEKGGEHMYGEYVQALKKVEGNTCKRAIIPYPPGIPMLVKGEVISLHHIEEIARLLSEGRSVMGIEDILDCLV